jgi:hypothetical protein
VACGFNRRESQPGIAGRTTPRRNVREPYNHSPVGLRRGGTVVKTLAIRLEDDQHAQLTAVAGLSDLTITDAIRQAIEEWIASRRSQPELTARAQSMLDEIEKEAAQRRDAIAALFGNGEGSGDKTTEEGEPSSSRRSPRGKGGSSAES